jgi:hypothetical protein
MSTPSLLIIYLFNLHAKCIIYDFKQPKAYISAYHSDMQIGILILLAISYQIRNKQANEQLLSINFRAMLTKWVKTRNHESMLWIKSFRAALVRRGMSARVYSMWRGHNGILDVICDKRKLLSLKMHFHTTCSPHFMSKRHHGVSAARA